MAMTGRVLLALALALYLTIPAALLTEMGIPYDSPGGSFLIKFHPGTWVLVLAVIVLSGRNPLRGLAAGLWTNKALAIQLGCFSLLLIFTLLRHGPSGSAFVIETLITVPLALLALTHLDQGERRKLLTFVMAILVVNSMLAIGEALLGERLMPHTVAGGTEIPDLYFRATALLGHPLNNAMITAPAVVLALGLTGAARWLVPALLMTALLAFGGRTAFGAAGGLVGLVLLWRGAAGLLTRRWSYAGLAGGLLAIVLICAMAMGAIAASGLGERIFENPLWDDSAEVRVVSLNALDYMTGGDIAFGMAPAAIETVIFRLGLNYPLETIENFWVLMLMQFGAVGLALFVIGMLAGSLFVWRRTDALGRLALILFVAVASSNNSLAAKNPAAPLVFALVTLYGRPSRHLPKAQSDIPTASFRSAAIRVGSIHPL